MEPTCVLYVKGPNILGKVFEVTQSFLPFSLPFSCAFWGYFASTTALTRDLLGLAVALFVSVFSYHCFRIQHVDVIAWQWDSPSYLQTCLQNSRHHHRCSKTLAVWGPSLSGSRAWKPSSAFPSVAQMCLSPRCRRWCIFWSNQCSIWKQFEEKEIRRI